MSSKTPPLRPPNRKEIKKEATKLRLVNAARELFRTYGYEDVSVTEIARAAGVTHGIINAHFHSKAGLLFEMRNQDASFPIAESWEIARGTGTVRERIARMVDLWLEDELSHPHEALVIRGFLWQMPPEYEERQDALIAEALDPILHVLNDGVQAGEIAEDFDQEALLRGAQAVFHLGARPALLGRCTRADACNLICRQINLLLDGARP